ncbi:hypothetical protein CRG98_007877 [Punica granatum]|uniref:PAZ domain-containing protein n=1 Tax=Punica granatum TaxID=22663 RepID=A0A2I0KTE1_PUNGR|nr:hypothetical protein CRG98_007877 [Punica granatum]
MVRKRRTEPPTGGEGSSSNPQESSGVGRGRGAPQQPQQFGGGPHQGGRGGRVPQAQRGGYGGGRGRSIPQQQYAPSEYQPRGGRGGAPPQHGGRGGYGARGGMVSGRKGLQGASPRTVPDLHQAIPAGLSIQPVPSEADMSSTAFIEPLPVIEFVARLLNPDVIGRPLSDSNRVKIKKALRGVKVEVTHRGNMRRKYRISGLTPQATRELRFDDRGTMKSVVEYFYKTYRFVIQHTQWPCLQVGNQNRPNYLPMEVCKIVEGQRYSKRLNKRQITALLTVTCQRPHEREQDILRVSLDTLCLNMHSEIVRLCIHITWSMTF